MSCKPDPAATYATMTPAAFGKSLRGLGVNLLCRDVRRMADYMAAVFGLEVFRLSADFAILRHDETVFQLHADATYRAHPLLGVLPETPPRGAGVQLYLFGIDPDAAVERAPPEMVLEPPADKPHGLREATILTPEGYAFSPARAL